MGWGEDPDLDRGDLGFSGEEDDSWGGSVCESLSSESEEFMLPLFIPKLWRIQGRKGLGNKFLATVHRMDVVGTPGD